MGDAASSEVFAALLALYGVTVTFAMAFFVRQRGLRFIAGALLLAGAGFLGMVSYGAALTVAGLAVAALLLATKTPRGMALEAKPTIGVFLLSSGVFLGVLSLEAALTVTILGIAALIWARKTPRSA